MGLFEADHEGNLADVWSKYVVRTFLGSDGRDGDVMVKERFGVRLSFPGDADMDVLHPEMDPKRDEMYVRKMLGTTVEEALGGSYGRRMSLQYRDNEGRPIDQLAWIVDRLIAKPESKNACANLLHPLTSSIERDEGMKRTACLISIQGLIRDDQFVLLANFRSQDAVGSHGNFRGLRQIQDKLLGQFRGHGVEVTRGQLYVHVAVAHVYERDFELARRLHPELP